MTSDLRSENARRTRTAIRTAAVELALEHGYAAMTVDDVAQRAGVSRRTVFNYFPTKADLVIVGIPSPSPAAVERFVAGQGSLLGDLRDLLIDVVEHIPFEEWHIDKIPALLRDNPELGPTLHAHVHRFASRLGCFAARRLGTDEGDLRVRVLVEAAGVIHRSAVDLWSSSQEREGGALDRSQAITAVAEAFEGLFAAGAGRSTGPPGS